MTYLGVFALLVLAVASLVIRWRRGMSVEREQIKWVALATAILLVVEIVNVATFRADEAALDRFTQGGTIAVAASTLAVFALFQPLRRRVQHVVDRRFDRARYDADRTAEAFAGRLRDGTDMATVTSDLAATANATVAPRSLTIWLRPSRVRR